MNDKTVTIPHNK